jgi:hypothetical protein
LHYHAEPTQLTPCNQTAWQLRANRLTTFTSHPQRESIRFELAVAGGSEERVDELPPHGEICVSGPADATGGSSDGTLTTSNPKPGLTIVNFPRRAPRW